MSFFESFFTNTLGAWQWLVLAAVPPAILLLYFLKLKRQPLEVPSTYLWSRTIEDLHVNSIWQRLRQSLLLFLQLLLVALIILACLRPGWRGTQLSGDRFIIMIDTSASMSATDVHPTRLDEAKRRALAIIDQMKSGDAVMIISFSDSARTEVPFTDNRRALRTKIPQIAATNRTTNLDEALRLAAAQANPGRSSVNTPDSLDVRVAEARPATLYILSDGAFDPVTDFSLGNLEPKYVKIGESDSENLGVVAFSVERNPEKPGQMQAFARIENASGKELSTDVTLQLDGQLFDAQKVTIAPHESGGATFDLQDLERGLLKVELSLKDALALDNVAYSAVNLPRPARVLVVTPRNEVLELALKTDEAAKLATVDYEKPAALEEKAHLELVAAGYYDLVVYDQCAPKVMPQANTLFIGRVPPAEGWSGGEKSHPRIIDVDRAHPLMQLVELSRVEIVHGFSLKAPRGASTLIDADFGPLAMIAPRQGFEDAVLGFEIIGLNDNGEYGPNSDWYLKYSFPVFVRNMLEYLGGGRTAQATPSVKPGSPITLRTENPADKLYVKPPSGERQEIVRDSPNTFVFTDTREIGVYDVFEEKAKTAGQQFAVNLFDSRETDLRPAEDVVIGHSDVKAQSSSQATRRELWKWVLIAGLVVLTFEWYVYNRRVYF